MKDLRPLLLALVTLALCLSARAQEREPSQGPVVPLDRPAAATQPKPVHRFWDKTNALLFVGVAGARYLDYGSTIYMRNRGVNEGLLTNDIVDNHAAFFAIEAAGCAASYALSYAFHATGHHKLERAVSIIHIGVGTGGAIRNFTLP